jgi:hypothetical protein
VYKGDDKMKEELKEMSQIARWSLFGLLLVIVGSFIYLSAWPHLRDKWFSGWRSSNEYITTQQTLLLKLVSEYNKLEVDEQKYSNSSEVVSTIQGQRTAILERIRQEASKLDIEQVPQSVQEFLRSHR